jgi:hypothetical protein
LNYLDSKNPRKRDRKFCSLLTTVSHISRRNMPLEEIADLVQVGGAGRSIRS